MNSLISEGNLQKEPNSRAESGKPASSGLYKIKTIASIAGVSSNLLRAWERRYQLISPSRQAGNQRLYSEADLLILKRVRKLLESGLSIGEVAALGRENLLAGALFSEVQELDKKTPDRTSLPQVVSIEPQQRALLMELASPHLKSLRSDRFAGENLSVSLRELAPDDLSTVHRIYQVLKGLFEVWTYMEQRTVPEILVERLKVFQDRQFQSQIATLGTATVGNEPLLRAALDDARCGPLALLIPRCQGANFVDALPRQLNILLTLARDHAKMMRNAFHDLDLNLREADESRKVHEVEPALKKILAIQQGASLKTVGADYLGAISSRCLETSALDRVLYDFLNRFARAQNTAEEAANLWVAQLDSKLCRWVFEYSGQPPTPLQAGHSSSMIVAQAMGVTPEEALEQGYLGHKEAWGRHWTWFHWPLYEPPADAPVCRCDPLSDH